MTSAAFKFPQDVAIVGWACRFPGADSVDELWALLRDGRCSIAQVPEGRFPLGRFGHPHRQERGRSYTWAAGVLPRIWDFDPTVFGISPREAVQMDPQQRLLLQLTWEALEDAGIPPSSLGGLDVGVYVGACQVEYGHRFGIDHAVADAHFATGSALSIAANRISYSFDLRGPSMVVDTACSSSIVALHEAVQALRSGRIDTAIVGGVNLIESPSSFIAFSQASMLSPSGACRAFSADADGFVRAEGAGIMVLQHADRADLRARPVHGYVLATDVNSDGRKSGISLPSLAGQEALLRRIYLGAGVEPNQLAFVEAHGTGTPVGDPIEATALGRALGEQRDKSRPLLIGSVKTNIGHLEAAAGMAGLFKTLLALNQQQLPPSLGFAKPNPHIEFEKLNLSVCTNLRRLAPQANQIAGINSFGFGGTNAHAIVGRGRTLRRDITAQGPSGSLFTFSAESKAALAALAQEYARQTADLSEVEIGDLSAGAVHRRDALTERAVIMTREKGDLMQALKACASDAGDPRLVVGQALGRDLPVAFVYSGNGSQFVGMGRLAFQQGRHFSERFDYLDSHFEPLAGWSLRKALFSDDLAERLGLTHVAQPLLFAIQSAMTAELAARGLSPSIVLGHSVGEVAAAEAAGIISPETAVALIYYRSRHQQQTQGLGRMAAVRAPIDVVSAIVEGIPGLEIAAINSPRTVTIAGSLSGFEAFKRGFPRLPVLDLGLDYPFHTEFMERIRQGLLCDLGSMASTKGMVPFVSSVTGGRLDGADLNAEYWWRNVREPVRFFDAVKTANEVGARVFVEIGPRPSLTQHVNDVFEVDGARQVAVLSVLHQRQEGQEGIEPFGKAVAEAIIAGARLDLSIAFGGDPGPVAKLPRYPWQNKEYRFQHTSESFGGNSVHLPLLGMRYRSDATEWYSNVDTALYPEFQGHRVAGRPILPGSAFLEIALSAGREWLQGQNPVLGDFEILQPLDLAREGTYELRTRISPASGVVEIASRPRLSSGSWALHARCRLSHGHDHPPALPGFVPSGRVICAEDLYASVADGLDYRAEFRGVEQVIVGLHDLLDVRLKNGRSATQYVLDPVMSDCCGHGIFAVFEELRARERGVTYIPVRTDRIALYKAHAVPARAIIQISARGPRAIIGNYIIVDAEGEVIAHISGIRGQAIPTRKHVSLGSMAFVELPRLLDGNIIGDRGSPASVEDVVQAGTAAGVSGSPKRSRQRCASLLDKWASAAAFEFAKALEQEGRIDPPALVRSGRLAPEMQPWLRTLLSHLERAGLATAIAAEWRLAPARRGAGSRQLLDLLRRSHPERAAELALAGWISGLIRMAESEGRLREAGQMLSPDSAMDLFSLTGTAAQDGATMLLEILKRCQSLWPRDRAVQVLVIGYGAVARALSAPPYRDFVRLTVYEPDHRSYDRAFAARSVNRRFDLVGEDGLTGDHEYDVIVGCHSLWRLPLSLGLRQLRGMLSSRGLLMAIEPAPSIFADIVLGADAQRFRRPEGAGRLFRQPDGWLKELRHAGFRQAAAEMAHGRTGSHLLLVGKCPGGAGAARRRPPSRPIALISGEATAGQLTAALAGHFKRELGSLFHRGSTAAPSNIPPDGVILFVGGHRSSGDPQEDLLQRCRELQKAVEQVPHTGQTLWLVFSGALSVNGVSPCPGETAAWAFSRVLANEHPKQDIRRIDVSPGTAIAFAAKQIAAIVRSRTAETELHTDGQAIRAVRVMQLGSELDRPFVDPNYLVHLFRAAPPSQRIEWIHRVRRELGREEVEIEVEYAGLNFRDLMWSLGLLPDEMLEDGFAGPALGLECSGRVLRVGSAVKQFQPGDQVMALAADCIATHVVAKDSQVAKLPRGIGAAAGATIPVAFMTAYYSLIKLAKLAAGEVVLVHGGAGAVGMAAIQIAKWRGAKVIATAGSSAKRELLRALGVEHVLDSRTTTFLEEVLQLTATGVDVVLNSLAGEAMEASIASLRPFGRFVELGKRDYVLNTNIGLRPFRRNLSYFGVDLDQLVTGHRRKARAVFAELTALFDRGLLQPLPFSCFPGEAVTDAFKLMQESLHVGKIIVSPPDRNRVPAAPKMRPFPAAGTHVITGAFGGFGIEAAKWLVDQGVQHLALFGRSGAATPAAQALLRDLAHRGVKVVADPLDIADADAVQRAFEKLQKEMPPVAGVMHAAMVLEDGIAANLDDDRFRRVFAPKIQGAENLDAVTRDLSLEYFVLFSSITTIAGHHGQGNYVAANAYLEGLARQRRLNGQPAVAIAWGIISDVGAAALNEKARRNLMKLAAKKGMSEDDALAMIGMPARQALDVLGQVLIREAGPTDPAVLVISPSGARLRRDFAPILKSPTYEEFVSDQTDSALAEVDLAALLRTEDIEIVRGKLTKLVVEQLAKVLHTRSDDISRSRPLRELGLDSLMTLELAMDLEGSIGLDMSLASSVGSLTIPALVDEILAQAASSGQTEEQAPVEALPSDAVALPSEPEPVAAKQKLVA